VRRLPSNRVSGVIAAALAIVAIAGTALAYFSAAGAGDAAAAVSKLPAPSITTAAASAGGTVTLVWSGVSAPDGGAVTYYVTRDGGSPVGKCPNAGTPAAVTTCVDTGVPVGTHSYTVTAVWRTWTAASSVSTANMTIGPATHFTLSATTTTPVAGAGDSLTIAAKDANEATVTTYAGSHSLVFAGASASPGGSTPTVADSSGTDIAFGAATDLTFSAGVASVSSSKNGVMKIYRAGAAGIAATEGSLTTTSPLAITVSPLSAAKLSLAATTTTPAAAATDNLTTTAQDIYGNTATAYTGTKNLTFSGAVASPSGTLPTVANSSGTAINFGSVTALTFSAGVAAVTSTKNGVMRLYKAGAASIAVTDGTLTTPSTLAVTVSPLVATKFSLAATTATPAAGAANDLTITAQDTYGNVATSHTGSHSLVFSGASSSPGGNAATVSNSAGTNIAFGAATAIVFSAGVATASGIENGEMTLYKSGAASVKATEGSITTPTALVVTVSPLSATKFSLAAATATPAAGATDDLTITALDPYGNTAPSFTGSHSLVFSGASASSSGNTPTVSNSTGANIPFGSATELTFSAGVAIPSGIQNGEMTLYKSGATSVTATEGSMTNTTALAVTVAPGAATKLALTAVTLTPVAAATDNLTTTAQDIYGNTATAYTGSKNLTFSGAVASPSGTLPTVANSSGTAINFGSVTALTFTAGIAAVSSSKNGVMRLYKAGATSVAVTDGTISTATPLALTVAVAAATRLGLVNVALSAGTITPPCLFTCVVTLLGNSGTITANIAVTDSAGNTASAVGSGHTAKVTATGGSVVGGTTLSFPATGPAVSTTTFTYTAPASGVFSNTITAAVTAGTAYTSATATASQ
jgi:hypothetical protein